MILKYCSLYSRASRYLRRVLFIPLRQGNRGFEPHSGHLKVYLFAYGCVLSFVGTRLLTVLRGILANI